MDIVKVFGTNLKKYRKAQGLSQEEFAEKCGYFFFPLLFPFLHL